jgi:hypothetical protein
MSQATVQFVVYLLVVVYSSTHIHVKCDNTLCYCDQGRIGVYFYNVAGFE